MLSLRSHVIICLSLFGAMIGMAIIGNVAQAAGAPPPTGAIRIVLMVAFFAIFYGFVLSCVPVMVKLVLGTQRRIGNANVPVVQAALKRERTIIFVIWGLMLAGTAIAVPAMILDGAFS